MRQELCDHIDQLDLALDQLALKDRNFDRFAIMLIDNVAELVLHQHALSRARKLELQSNKDVTESKLILDAQGQHFDKKVKLANHDRLISPEVAASLRRLHSFRNTAYHQGLRHEGILHSLAIFYFLNCCDLAASYKPGVYAFGPDDEISHRAIKYVINNDPLDNLINPLNYFSSAWARLKAVGEHMKLELVKDLSADMLKTIDSTDENIRFILNNAPQPRSDRNKVVLNAQAWSIAFSEKGQQYACARGYAAPSPIELVGWLLKNYPFESPTDPIPAWKERHRSLTRTKNPHKALEHYCNFMSQTADVRAHIEDSMLSLDRHMQLQIDFARGK